MKISVIKSVEELWNYMTEPSQNLIECVSQLEGRIVVLGGSGKMGKELVGLIRNADKVAGKKREIIVASTFSNPYSDDVAELLKLDVKCYKGDLSDEAFLASLPDAPYVVYMMGFKFGSSKDWKRAFHLNSIVPYLVGRKYSDSSIVVFSSGNPYPHTSRLGEGCVETDALMPQGIYGWSIVARESSFLTTLTENENQKVSIYRLMYAQHFYYGVLVDLARMVLRKEPVSLAMPAVNIISQRDANEAAIRSFEKCNRQGWIFNVAGPIWQVREIVERIGSVVGEKPVYFDEEPDTALLADDTLCQTTFGKYRDNSEELIDAVAAWVKNGGKLWDKPTYFGKVKHEY